LSILSCVHSGKFVLPILCEFHSKWHNPPLWLIKWGKGLVEDLTLYELLNGDVASLVRVNFGNKYLVSCAYCIYLVFVDLDFVLCRSTYSNCCASHLRSYTGRGRIRFLGSASRGCSRSSPRRIFHPTTSPHGPTAFVVSSNGSSSSSTLQPKLSTCSVIWSIF
jgi:hypothetical protein